MLPQALVSGLGRGGFLSVPAIWIFPVVLITFLCGSLEAKGHREWAVGTIALLTTIAVVRLVWEVYPVLDRQASARAKWRSNPDSITCVSNDNRSLRYGLSYYSGRSLRDCN